MITPRILASGMFTPSDLHITVAASNRKIDPATESQLNTAWESMVRQSQQEGRLLYNGSSYRLNSFVHTNGTLKLELAPFDYKIRDGLIRIPNYFTLDEPYYRKGCYATATVRTADGAYLMVRLSGKSMSTLKIDNIGGIVDAEPPITSGSGLFAALYKEFAEEALITEQDISRCYLRAMLLEQLTNVGFYFEVTLRVTAKDIIARQDHGELDQEIASVLVLSRDEYITTLQKADASKQLIATMVLI